MLGGKDGGGPSDADSGVGTRRPGTGGRGSGRHPSFQTNQSSNLPRGRSLGPESGQGAEYMENNNMNTEEVADMSSKDLKELADLAHDEPSSDYLNTGEVKDLDGNVGPTLTPEQSHSFESGAPSYEPDYSGHKRSSGSTMTPIIEERTLSAARADVTDHIGFQTCEGGVTGDQTMEAPKITKEDEDENETSSERLQQQNSGSDLNVAGSSDNPEPEVTDYHDATSKTLLSNSQSSLVQNANADNAEISKNSKSYVESGSFGNSGGYVTLLDDYSYKSQSLDEDKQASIPSQQKELSDQNVAVVEPEPKAQPKSQSSIFEPTPSDELEEQFSEMTAEAIARSSQMGTESEANVATVAEEATVSNNDFVQGSTQNLRSSEARKANVEVSDGSNVSMEKFLVATPQSSEIDTGIVVRKAVKPAMNIDHVDEMGLPSFGPSATPSVHTHSPNSGAFEKLSGTQPNGTGFGGSKTTGHYSDSGQNYHQQQRHNIDFEDNTLSKGENEGYKNEDLNTGVSENSKDISVVQSYDTNYQPAQAGNKSFALNAIVKNENNSYDQGVINSDQSESVSNNSKNAEKFSNTFYQQHKANIVNSTLNYSNENNESGTMSSDILPESNSNNLGKIGESSNVGQLGEQQNLQSQKREQFDKSYAEKTSPKAANDSNDLGAVNSDLFAASTSENLSSHVSMECVYSEDTAQQSYPDLHEGPISADVAPQVLEMQLKNNEKSFDQSNRTSKSHVDSLFKQNGAILADEMPANAVSANVAPENSRINSNQLKGPQLPVAAPQVSGMQPCYPAGIRAQNSALSKSHVDSLSSSQSAASKPHFDNAVNENEAISGLNVHNLQGRQRSATDANASNAEDLRSTASKSYVDSVLEQPNVISEDDAHVNDVRNIYENIDRSHPSKISANITEQGAQISGAVGGLPAQGQVRWSEVSLANSTGYRNSYQDIDGSSSISLRKQLLFDDSRGHNVQQSDDLEPSTSKSHSEQNGSYQRNLVFPKTQDNPNAIMLHDGAGNLRNSQSLKINHLQRSLNDVTGQLSASSQGLQNADSLYKLNTQKSTQSLADGYSYASQSIRGSQFAIDMRPDSTHSLNTPVNDELRSLAQETDLNFGPPTTNPPNAVKTHEINGIAMRSSSYRHRSTTPRSSHGHYSARGMMTPKTGDIEIASPRETSHRAVMASQSIERQIRYVSLCYRCYVTGKFFLPN